MMNNEIKPKSNLMLIWLLSYISIASFSSAIITPALPKIEAQYGLSNGSVEWVVSAFLIGYVIGQLIYGPMANQFGRLKALRIGLIINLVGCVFCLIALPTNLFWPLLLGRLITALGAAGGLACTFMLINEWLPESQRKTALAYAVLSFALSGLSVMLGGIITEYWQWQGCFWFLTLHAMVMLVGTAAFSETLKKAKPICVSTIMHDYSLALNSPKLITFSLIVGYCTAICYCFSAAGPQIAEKILGISAAEYGYWNNLNIIGMLLGGVLAKKLLGCLPVLSVIVLGFIGVAVGVINLWLMWCFANQSTLWFFLISASLYLFSSLLFSGGSMVASNALEDKASSAAMMSFVNMSSATLAVILMGYLSRNSLLSFIYILSLLWFLLMVLLLWQRK
ncbi:MAG: MFS transporter [Proteobacteria bacterium]|nr:MFS transporter [Pseudomonadota bacterium]